MNLIEWAESGWLPDFLIRKGIRRLLRKRLKRLGNVTAVDDFVANLRDEPLAVATDAANRQHYEVPAEFFLNVLGPRLKYSSCWFSNRESTLTEAEERMLDETCTRAQLGDGMRILELGCGWGSLSLWIAEKFPRAEITALSNSRGQRDFIERQTAERGITNLNVVTCDMRDFTPSGRFDRIVSVEMFEHMRNYELLFRRVANWLDEDGRAFAHVFCHRHTPYLFETEGADNWLGRHFFTGGTMPSEELFSRFSQDLAIERQWRVNGLHYWRTCEAWLANLDRNRELILSRFARDLSNSDARRHLQRWRMFFMACVELFRYRRGHEWFVAHYLFRPAPTAAEHHPSRRLSVV